MTDAIDVSKIVTTETRIIVDPSDIGLWMAGLASDVQAVILAESSLRDYARAEAEWLSQPENRIDAVCQWCLHEPCVCDVSTDEYRDYLMERDHA